MRKHLFWVASIDSARPPINKIDTVRSMETRLIICFIAAIVLQGCEKVTPYSVFSGVLIPYQPNKPAGTSRCPWLLTLFFSSTHDAYDRAGANVKYSFPPKPMLHI